MPNMQHSPGQGTADQQSGAHCGVTNRTTDPAAAGATGGAPGGAAPGGSLPLPPQHQHQQTPPPGSCGGLAQPPPPVIDGSSLIQLTPQALQQLLANAVSGGGSSSPKCPKFWVFRGHYESRNFSQLDLFKALLPLLPTLAVSLCRPLVTAPTPTVMDDAQQLLLQHYELGPMERGRALVHCTSLGDHTPREMLQYMGSLQPGEHVPLCVRQLAP